MNIKPLSISEMKDLLLDLNKEKFVLENRISALEMMGQSNDYDQRLRQSEDCCLSRTALQSVNAKINLLQNAIAKEEVLVFENQIYKKRDEQLKQKILDKTIEEMR